jgi:hypothetical protein
MTDKQMRICLSVSKPELSDLDRELLAILTSMAWNYQNIQQIRLPLRIEDETMQ